MRDMRYEKRLGTRSRTEKRSQQGPLSLLHVLGLEKLLKEPQIQRYRVRPRSRASLSARLIRDTWQRRICERSSLSTHSNITKEAILDNMNLEEVFDRFPVLCMEPVVKTT
jgi:hypothetical protein